jgi:hypothetical protein
MLSTILFNLLFFAFLGFAFIFVWQGLFGDQGLKGALSGKVKVQEPIKLVIGIAAGAGLVMWFARDFTRGPDASLWITRLATIITDFISSNMNPWAPEGTTGVASILWNSLYILLLAFTVVFAYFGLLGSHGVKGAMAGTVKATDPLLLILAAAFGAGLLLWSALDFIQGPNSSLWVVNAGKIIVEILTQRFNPWQP